MPGTLAGSFPGYVEVNGVRYRFAPGSYSVIAAPRFGEKISTGDLRYRDFNPFEQAHPVGDFSGGYGLRRYTDLPENDDGKTFYDETNGADARFGYVVLGPYTAQETLPSCNGTPIWIGEFVPREGALKDQRLLCAVGGTFIWYRNTNGTWTQAVTLPAQARVNAVAVFNGRLMVGFGAEAAAIFTPDLTSYQYLVDGSSNHLFAFAMTTDQAAAYIAGGPSTANVNTITSSVESPFEFDTTLTECGSVDAEITGLVPGGGVATVYVGKEDELGEIDANGIYRSLVPFDSHLPTNCQVMRWWLASGEEAQRGSLSIIFSRDRSIWTYQPSSQHAGVAANISPWAKRGIRPTNYRGVLTAAQGTARWMYEVVEHTDDTVVPAIDLAVNTTGGGSNSDATTALSRRAVAFSPQVSGHLTQIGIRCRLLTPGLSIAIQAQIIPIHSSGRPAQPTDYPDGVVPALATSTTGYVTLDSHSTVSVTFPAGSQPFLVKGVRYAVAFSGDFGSGTVRFWHNGAGVDTYGLSPWNSEDGGATWTADPNTGEDRTIETWMQQAVTSYVIARDASGGRNHSFLNLGATSCQAAAVTAIFQEVPYLFLGDGGYIQRVQLALDGEMPLDDPTYFYALSGTLTTPDIELGFPDERKYPLSVIVVAENISAGQRTIGVEYSLDGGAWTTLGTVVEGPSTELTFSNPTAARRIKLRFTLATDDRLETPVMLAFSLRMNLDTKNNYRIWKFTAPIPLTEQAAGDESVVNAFEEIEDLWTAYENGSIINYRDRWGRAWKVRILEFEEAEAKREPDKEPESMLRFALLQVRGSADGFEYGDTAYPYGGKSSIYGSS